MWQLWVFTAPHELFLFALGDSLRWLLLLMSTYVGPVLSSLLFFPFGMGLPIRCRPIIVFWQHIACWFHRLTTGEQFASGGIVPE